MYTITFNIISVYAALAVSLLIYVVLLMVVRYSEYKSWEQLLYEVDWDEFWIHLVRSVSYTLTVLFILIIIFGTITQHLHWR